MTAGSGRRQPLRAALLVAAGAFLAFSALWSTARPLLLPLAQRATLSPQARATSAGIPLPAVAHPCAAQATHTGGVVTWCLPGNVSLRTIERWYDGVLRPGHDAGALTWCVAQTQSDGTRRELWSDGTGLVGYELPPSAPRQDASGRAVIGVVRLPHRTCPAATRSTRTAAHA